MNDRATENRPAIVARGLMKSYVSGRIVALNGIDLQVAVASLSRSAAHPAAENPRCST